MSDSAGIDVVVDDAAIVVSFDGLGETIPFGIDAALRDHLRSDPPRPEELTNVIGLVTDHLEDLFHVRPDIGVALDDGGEVSVSGHGLAAFADTEAGGPTPLPCRIDRDDAEDLFRTLVTESRDERRRNPGLPHDEVDRIVAVACIVVAVLRSMRRSSVTVVDR